MADPTIYLVRHGQTVWNVEGRLQGQLDSPLTALGMDQARAAGQRLRQSIPAGTTVAIESSPRGRSLETARVVADELGLDRSAITIDERLAEHHMGDWAGLTHAELDERFPAARKARAADKWGFVVPGGESYALLLVRARAWLAEDRPVPVTVAVTHEMMSRAIQGAYAGLEPAAIMSGAHPQDRVYRLHAGSIAELIA